MITFVPSSKIGIMKKHFFIILLWVCSMTVWAVPAQRGLWRVIHLSDGSTVSVELRGDEYQHWWEDSLGNRYSIRGSTNEDGGRTMDFLRKGRRIKKDGGRRNTSPFHLPPSPFNGSFKGLIILAEFADRSFQEAHATELYRRIANEERFEHELGFHGSVHDYFKDQSEGRFLLDFDVVGPVRLSMNYAYYGENDTDGQDLRAGEMVAEACKLAAKEVDYADYDWDGDGEVEQVVVLFAGQGEHCCEDAATIWPHEFALEAGDYGHTLKIDGVTISTYACCSELGLDGNIDGIGTLCHEFSHCLGIPDMYDTEDNGCFGMSRWDIMDYGCYNGNGFTPCGYTSYERMICGWKQPIILTNEREVSNMQPLSDNGNTFIIYNRNSPNEYYLLENRQQVGWDKALPGSGLLVLHVDENEEAWMENRVNTDPDHPRCTLFHADNDLSQLRGDPYPYNGNDSLTAFSIPAATLYNKSERGDLYMPMAITDITQQENGNMSFHFRPTIGTLTDPADGVVFYEQFSGCNGKGGNDGRWGGSIALAQFVPDHEGWESAKCYGANQCAKFGTTSAHGMAITPAIYLNGEYELSFLAAPWNDEENFMWLDVESGTATVADHLFDRMKNQQWNEHHTTVTGHGWVKLLFYGNSKRFFLDEVIIRKKVGIATSDKYQVSSDKYQVSSDKYQVSSEGWYTIDGRKLNGMPRENGVFIRNGKKIVRIMSK